MFHTPVVNWRLKITAPAEFKISSQKTKAVSLRNKQNPHHLPHTLSVNVKFIFSGRLSSFSHDSSCKVITQTRQLLLITGSTEIQENRNCTNLKPNLQRTTERAPAEETACAQKRRFRIWTIHAFAFKSLYYTCVYICTYVHIRKQPSLKCLSEVSGSSDYISLHCY